MILFVYYFLYTHNMSVRQITFSNATITPIDTTNVASYVGGEYWIAVATTGDNMRMVMCSLPHLYFSTFNTTTNQWNDPTVFQFGTDAIGHPNRGYWGYVSICVTEDGSRVMISNYFADVSVYFWNGTTYENRVSVPDNIEGRQWTGLACTPDGSTLVCSEQYGGVYYSTWNTTTGNYNAWTRTDAPDTNSAYITITEDASKIVYGGGDHGDGCPISYMLWNEAAQNYGPNVIMFPEQQSQMSQKWKGFSITRDGGILIAADAEHPGYVVFDPSTNTYGPLIPISQNVIHGGGAPPRYTWLSYDESTIYYSWSGASDINIIYQASVYYTIDGVLQNPNNGGGTPPPPPPPPPPSSDSPPLYLGDEIVVDQSNVYFNDANVFVKAPTAELHTANKAYVDSNHTASIALIEAETAERIASNMAMSDMIASLEAVKDDLSSQLNNLYQYFFNQNRDGPVPVREPRF